MDSDVVAAGLEVVAARDRHQVVGCIGIEDDVRVLTVGIALAGTCIVVYHAAAHVECVGLVGTHVPAAGSGNQDLRPVGGVAHAADAADIEVVVDTGSEACDRERMGGDHRVGSGSG